MNVGCAGYCSFGVVRSRSANSNTISLDVVRILAPHAESTASSHLLFLAVVLMDL